MKRWLPLGALVAMVCGMAWAARPPEAGADIRVAFVLFSLFGSGAALVAIRLMTPGATVVLGVAVVLRLIVMPLQPTLSEDGNRYLWDGYVQTSGVSPYAFTPREWIERGNEAPVPLAELNSPDYHSVYPPVSQAGFALAVWLGSGDARLAWIVWKVMLTLVEVAGIVALLRLVSPEAAGVYAWHPVSVVEIAGQGHTEGLALGFLALSLVAVVRQRAWWGGGLLALAGWVKLWPFALVLPLLSRRLLAAAMLVGVVVAVPFVVGSVGAAESLSLYAGTFDFYSAPFLIAKSALWPLAGESSSRIVSTAMAAMITISVAVIAFRRREQDSSSQLVVGIGSTILVITLLSPTLHPWHLTPALFAVALLGSSQFARPIFWLVSFAPVTYLLYVGLEWAYGLAIAAGWGGALVLAMGRYRSGFFSAVLRRRGLRKWERVRAYVVNGGDRLLDYGAAEGFVGLAAAQDGLSVILADRTDEREVDLPFVRCTETSLPLADDSVDSTVLVFVLHHARTPESVLREATRVTRGAVLVWETVPAPWMPISVLKRIDAMANRQRPGDETLRPAHLRSVANWDALFERVGLRATLLQRWGWLHPQALWRIERV